MLRHVFWILLSCPIVVIAHPVTFEDGIAFSHIVQPHTTLTEAAYSVSPRLAFGTTFMRQRSKKEALYGGFVNTNLLIFRHNGEGSQANLYGIIGIGLGEADAHRPMGMTALQADFETTRFYTALMGRVFGDEEHQWWQGTYRIGLAPYEAEFSELQAWLVGQIMYMPHMERLPNASVLLRFFYRTVLWEIGGDFEGRPWLQLMIHY